MRIALLPLLAAVLAATLGCGEDRGSPNAPSYGGRGRVASTQGGAVVMTYDERIAVATNRTAGVVTIFELDPARPPESMVRSTTEIKVAADARPWAAVIGADDDTAYVLLRGSQLVAPVRHLHDHPTLDLTIAVRVGAEPTGLAITPSGSRLYVANFGDGTVSMITTHDLAAHQRSDLNLALARQRVLGPLLASDPEPGSWSEQEIATLRPGLAHPRALAMTDNGDAADDDETLYATEFFSQPIPNADPTDVDRTRQGFVYAIDVGSGQVATDVVALAPVNTGFSDAQGTPTSCFPNQLYAAAATAGKLYVTSVCASPRGPVGAGPNDPANPAAASANFKTLSHGALFVVDTSTNTEIASESGVLTRGLQDAYDADSSIVDRRMPLIPNDIAVSTPGGAPRAYVSALGADAVFAVDLGSGAPQPDPHFLDLRPAGRLPVAVALSRSESQPFALVLNDYSNTLSIVALDAGRSRATVEAAPEDGVNSAANEGHRVFATGLEIWSFQGQAWSSCESCHPEGLSDGVTWEFSRGPRRTISTAGTYGPDGMSRRLLLWTANVDEVHDVEAIARGVSGGTGGVLWNSYTLETPNKDCRLLFDGTTAAPVGGVTACPAPESTTYRLNGMNGSLGAITRQSGAPGCPKDTNPCDINGSQDWDHIDAFIRSIPAPRAPRICQNGETSISVACLDPDYVAAGRELFSARHCTTCHGGPSWTVSRVFYTPSLTSNGSVPYAAPLQDAPDPSDDALNAMLGTLRATTYAAGPLAALNPPGASAPAPFRSFAPSATSSSGHPKLDYLYGTTDQINCALRSVGTFPTQTAGALPNTVGVAPAGALAASESKIALTAPPPDAPAGTLPTYQPSLAAGKDGFNVPSLVGMNVAAAFFHAGNARSLEEVFSSTFALHHANPAITSEQEFTNEELKGLVSFLLSVDDLTPPVPLAGVDAENKPFDADLCAQFD